MIHGACSRRDYRRPNGQTAAQLLNRYKPEAFKVTAFSDNTAFPFCETLPAGRVMDMDFSFDFVWDEIHRSRLQGRIISRG